MKIFYTLHLPELVEYFQKEENTSDVILINIANLVALSYLHFYYSQ
jgi:hypothetical protein